MKANNEDALVSIVIPVYNVEAYIEKCLRSILQQSYINLEIIVVNDGSPDNSEEIIERLAATDSRIKYLKKENGGLSSARNAGIDTALGKYICFVDSDDWIDENFVRIMVRTMEEDGSDIAVCNMTYIYSDGQIKKRTPEITSDYTVTNVEALRDLFNGQKFKFHAQNKVYRSSLFKNTGIRYALGKIYEDVFTTYKLFFEAKKISYISENLYFYLQNRPGSILQTRFNRNRFDIYDALDEIHKFMETQRIPIEKEFQHLVVINTISLANYIYPIYDSLNADERNEFIEILKNTVTRYDLSGWTKNNCISIVEKVRFWMLLSDFRGYTRLMKQIKRGQK